MSDADNRNKLDANFWEILSKKQFQTFCNYKLLNL